MAGKLNLNSGCRGTAGLDGRIQILFSRHEYSSPQGRLSYNNKPLNLNFKTKNSSLCMVNFSGGQNSQKMATHVYDLVSSEESTKSYKLYFLYYFFCFAMSS